MNNTNLWPLQRHGQVWFTRHLSLAATKRTQKKERRRLLQPGRPFRRGTQNPPTCRSRGRSRVSHSRYLSPRRVELVLLRSQLHQLLCEVSCCSLFREKRREGAAGRVPRTWSWLSQRYCRLGRRFPFGMKQITDPLRLFELPAAHESKEEDVFSLCCHAAREWQRQNLPLKSKYLCMDNARNETLREKI